MARSGDRGGAKTRAHIAAVATAMFLERGFEDVTIAEVAAAAGVSKVTVFAHFERKEDLLLDRLPEISELVRRTVVDRADGADAVAALHAAAVALVEERHPLSGLGEGFDPFLRVLMGSPALLARLRAFQEEIEAELAGVLRDDAGFGDDAALAAALLVAAYRTVAVETVSRRLAGGGPNLATDHLRRLSRAFGTVARCVTPDAGA